jgi:hypothetical protein
VLFCRLARSIIPYKSITTMQPGQYWVFRSTPNHKNPDHRSPHLPV